MVISNPEEKNIKPWKAPSDKVKDIIDAVIEEYYDHESWDCYIGCIMNSEPLIKKLEEIVK